MNKQQLLESQPRTYNIQRHPRFGYGFIAGYESPTMVKMVTPEGPSYQRLMPGDIILAVNGINVENTSREQIIKMIQLCRDSIEIKVKQRSNIMPQAKIESQAKIEPQAKVMEIFDVVIKIFFEVGHYRVLKYNQDTTVATILETLNARLIGESAYAEQIKKYFGLALTVGVNSKAQPRESKRSLLHILDENDSIMKIRQLPYAPSLRLLYRMTNPPSDIGLLHKQHKVAFEYLYQQSCNDLRLERFTPELDQETALRLSALHILEYVHSNHSKAHGYSKDPKVYIRLIKKTPGLEHFLPTSMADKMATKKEAKKIREKLMESMKENFDEFRFDPPTDLNCHSSTSFHEIKSSPSDYIKLVFLNHLSQIPCGSTETISSITFNTPSPRSTPDYTPLLRNIMPPPSPANYLSMVISPQLTPMLTDEDIERLRVPPPPRMID